MSTPDQTVPPVPETPTGPALSAAAYDVLGPELVTAIGNIVKKADAATNSQDAKDFAAASLTLGQLMITLDPSRLAGGDTPEARAASMPAVPEADNAAPGTGSGDGDHDGQIAE